MKRTDDSPSQKRQCLPGADHPVLRGLETYWHSLRRARRLPQRTDIAPDQIDLALPYAFILQRVAPGIARMRVAGRHLHDLLKMDARGMPISTFFEPAARALIADLVEAAFQEPAIIAVPLLSHGRLLRPNMTGTMLLLPMSDEKGNTTRILGALVTDGIPGNRPRRFCVPDGALIRHETFCLHLASSQAIPRPHQKKGPDAQRPALSLVIDNT
ncbi:PAS domain-containing protein [Yoonia sp.]|uniref:PAS domain-containing protein n=1 Tax=Yoonia sp. TaxID=2212373 RepID=UPI0019E7DD8D|nr:PAS domain-containing protein [Yoonia sp.]MBE0413429.1 PAS domain-containing protein [Yoonia sp.]